MKAKVTWRGHNINTFRNFFGDGNISWKTEELYWDNKNIPKDLTLILNYHGIIKTLKLGDSFLF